MKKKIEGKRTARETQAKSRVRALWKKQGTLFIVSAPSGAGKTTLCHSVIKRIENLEESVSFCTRSPRKGEKNDVDYTFVSEEKFRDMISRGEFVEWAEVHGNLYGTSRKRLNRIIKSGCDVLLDIDTQGAAQIRKSFENAVLIFIVPPSVDVLRARLEARKSNSAADIERRMRKAKDEIKDYIFYDYVIVNDALKDSIKRLEMVILSQRLRRVRINREFIRNMLEE